MEFPYRFPLEKDVIYQEALAYRRLDSTARLRAILDLIASGVSLTQHSPHREETIRLQEACEAEWQRIQKELFAPYAR